MAVKRNEQRIVKEEASQSMWVNEQVLAGTAKSFAGVDEAGRGCIAGPVYAAAVVLGGSPLDWVGINDSKQLTKRKRDDYYELICERALAVSVGVASVEEIEKYNILHASRMAMGRAINEIGTTLQLVLVDGPYGPIFKDQQLPYIPVIDGDAKCLSIAAASIIAKVERDRWMEQMSYTYPDYGFESHVGYGTAQHLQALRERGPCPLHRPSFAPVQQYLQTRLDLP